jgi:hypothetical protein
MTGQRSHAAQEFIDTDKALASLIVTLLVEQEANAGQLHALGCERLVQFMGEGGGHLPERGQFGGLDQTVLGGSQVGGTGFDQTLQLITAALALTGQTPSLLKKEQGEDQGKPGTGGRKARGLRRGRKTRAVTQQV